MSDETKKSIRRVESSKQTEMFGAGSRTTPRRRLNEKGFVDPDPEELVFGTYLLREYLSRAGEDTSLLVRDVIRSIDYSEFEAAYSLTGRAPYHPAIMLGLLVYGVMQGKSTLRELETLAALDLGAHWITGGVIPDHSTLGKFIHRHESLITEEFFEALTREVIDRIGGVAQVWSGDGTVIESAANRYRTLRLEAAREIAEQMRAAAKATDEDEPGDDGTSTLEGDDSASAELRNQGTRETLDLNRLERAIEVGEQRAERRRQQGSDPTTTQICTTDPEAGIVKHKKSGDIGPGWVPSIITTSRLIIAAHTHPYSENQPLGEMFDQAKRVTGVSTAAVLMDTNYHSFSAVEEASRRDLLLLSPARNQGHERETRFYDKHRHFEWIPEEDAYRCPAGKTLSFSYHHHDKRRGTTRKIYRGSTSECAHCPLKAQCTLADRRQISRDVNEHQLEEVRELMNQEFPRALYAHRQGDVEPVYSEIKGVQGLTRFRRRGARGVQVEFSLHACAHNLRRLRTEMRCRAGGALQAAFALLAALLQLLEAICRFPKGGFSIVGDKVKNAGKTHIDVLRGIPQASPVPS